VSSLEAKVNAFLHANAASRLVNEKVGPFHIGFDADDPLIWLNYVWHSAEDAGFYQPVLTARAG
jgi:hypothetical protein